MKPVSLMFSFVLFLISMNLGGCISIPTTPSPRFYTIEAADTSQLVKPFDIEAGTVIGIGPVKIPEFLNRPQIVTINKDGLLEFSEFDRWGESLDSAFVRVINENLSSMLPQATVEMYPWNMNIAIKYQVIVHIIAMECSLDKNVLLTAQWTILDQSNKKAVFTKRSQLCEPVTPHNYFGLAKALSKMCLSLSKEMASELSSVAVAR